MSPADQTRDEGQGRKTADWLPFSRQFVLSADHLTMNQAVYKKEHSLKPNTWSTTTSSVIMI